MARSPERPMSPEPSTKAAGSKVEPQEKPTRSDLPPSPTHSNKSSESEGRPVREKLKETRIDAQNTSDPVPSSDLPMSDAPNGTNAATAQSRDQSPSESESDRGRLRRKRSREDFEDDQEGEKHPEKKERHAERHARKKSRDVTSPQDSDAELLAKSTKTSIAPIHENDGDETMLSIDESTRALNSTSKAPAVPDSGSSEDTTAVAKADEERSLKRPRDQSDPQPFVEANESKSKVPPGSGFANTSVASPFAALSPPPQTSKATETSTDQTSSDKFKASGFSSFSSSSASPFGGLGSTTSKSPFASASGGSKITGFASPPSTSSSTGGFAALGSSSGQSAFGGASAAPVGEKSVFGGALGNGSFGGFGGPKLGLPSFATPGQTSITGLSQKPAKTFGTQQKDVESDDDGGSGGEDDSANDGNEEQDGGSKFQHKEVETGEEGETTVWVGRAKLYTMVKEGSDKRWQERGVGAFKFNVTEDEPKKARFVLRADGTHRLILNAAVPKTMVFGDPHGKTPGDGRLYFNTPTAEGKVDMYLIKLKAERAVELHKEVTCLQKTML